jgi:hypothetical protein
MFLFEAGGTLQGVAGTATAITLTMSGVEVDMTSGAETFKVLVQTQLPSSAGVLGTVPAGKAWIVKTLTLNNSTASAVTGIQLFQNGSAAANSIIGGVTMAGHYTFTSSENGWSMVDAAGVIQQSGGGGGGGTVTSVGLSLPSQFAVSGSPVTGSGTLTAAWNNVTPNFAFFGPNGGSPAAPAFRRMVDADFPLAGANSVLVGAGAAGTGAAYTELTLGTNLSMSGTTLNAAGGFPAPTIVAGSATTEIDVTGAITSSNRDYMVRISNLKWNSGSSVTGFLQFSTNNGSTYDTTSANYNYGGHYTQINSGGATSGDHPGQTSAGFVLDGFSSDTFNSGNIVSIEFMMFNPLDATGSVKLITYNATFYLGASSVWTSKGSIYYINASGVNAFRVITTGTFTGTVICQPLP